MGTKEPGGVAIYTIRAPSDPTDVQRSGLEFFASVYAEEMTQALEQGLADTFSTDGLIVKFVKAWMLDYELRHENEPDGPLGRHLDNFPRQGR